MLLKELLEEKRNERYDNIEIFEEIGSGHGFHGDFIKAVADRDYDSGSIYDFWNAEVIDYEEMDSDDYYNTILANACVNKEDVEFDGYTLVIKIDDYEDAGFSNELKAYREKLSKSMKELSEELEVPYRTWQDWENDKSSPVRWATRLLLKELDFLVAELEEKIEKYEDAAWGELKVSDRTELLKVANAVDGRTGNDLREDGECIVDLSFGLSVPGAVVDGEIIIEDDAVVYNPSR